MDRRGGRVPEIDMRKFFDRLVHKHLNEILRRRVRDGAVLRLIGRWLHAGVLEEGRITYPRDRQSPGRRDLADAGQRIPVRGAGYAPRPPGCCEPSVEPGD